MRDSLRADLERLRERILPAPLPVSSPMSPPAPASQPPLLVALAGLPGSGKTALGRRLSERLPAVLLTSDEARFALVARPTYAAAESRRVFATLETLAAALLRDGVSVIFDATHMLERDRMRLSPIASESGATLLWVHATAPEPVILERLHRRQTHRDPRDRSEADEAAYRRMAAQFEPLHAPHLRIDTTDGVDGAAEAVLRALRPVS